MHERIESKHCAHLFQEKGEAHMKNQTIRRNIFSATLIATFLLAAGSAFAQRPRIDTRATALSTTYPTNILGISGTFYGQGSTIYDVNATNGNATNPRTPLYQSSGYKIPFAGITYVPYQGNNLLYGLTFSNMTYYASTLFTILPNPSFNSLGLLPMTGLNGSDWRCGLEGDIAYDKYTHKLYATCSNGGWKLVTLDPVSAAVTILGGNISSGGYYSALAVSPAGELFALDTVSRILVKLDKSTGAIQGSPIPLAGALPNTSVNGGMGFNDAGVLYAAFGGKLITINVTTGGINVIGNTVNFSGLVVQGGGEAVIIRKRTF
jgi:hypothetical protein